MESDLSLGLFETPEGTKFVLEEFGVSGPDLSFIKKYRGPLIEASEFDSEENLMGLLRNKIVQHYQANKSLFSEYDLTNREKLIASAVAQVNGSIATYAVKSRHPYNLDDILMIHNGNCSDFSLRLMIVLEAIGIKAAMISIVTSGLPGHIFVDAYDPISGSSFLLDSTWNLMVILHNSNGKSLIQFVSEATDAERPTIVDNLTVNQFPAYFRYIDPGLAGLSSSPLSLEYLNGQRDDISSLFRGLLKSELGTVKNWWKTVPSHRPRTLREMKNLGLADIPDYFDVSEDYAFKIVESFQLNE